MHAVFALNWEPQLRGIIIIIIAVVVLPGSVYMIMATNLGARLGFLMSFTALAGWMMLMGLVWWAFGIGLQGEDASWKPMKGQTILLDARSAQESEVLKTDAVLPAEGATPEEASATIEAGLLDNGWNEVGETDKAFGPSASAAGVFIEEDGSLKAGEYQVVKVFNKGGARYPRINDSIDFFAFFHEPRWNLVEVATLLPQRSEPGRAPARAEIDQTQPHRYVFMIRNLGHKRVPAALTALGSALVFFPCCYMLHTRDRRVAANRSKGLAVPATN